MRRSVLRLAGGTLSLLAVACAPPAPQASKTAAPSATPGWAVVVLYNQPKDTAAFEKYYAQTHLPLVGANQQEIGFTRAGLVRFPRNLDGTAPAIYRKAELWFDSEAALNKGIATPGFKKVADDLKNFATGGLSALVAVETNK
jgi:uncharacterized protein (TIGR02118 family)